MGRTEGSWHQRSEVTQTLLGQPAAPSETVGDVTMPCFPLMLAWQEGAWGWSRLLSGTSEEAWHVLLEAPKAPLRDKGESPRSARLCGT